ncbi:MAG: hypothetical protein LBT82_03355 [Oscillospiraceae bacterium]|jgi:hypothetical protein|nr:hypothetical protein [Oscillospiraceae bacterium]
MLFKKNLAYDLSLFEEAPEDCFNSKSNVIKISKTKFIKNRNILRKKTITSVICVSVVVLCGATNLVLGQVKLSELTQRVFNSKKLLEESKNDETRLKMQLESFLSLGEIEEYSKKLLMMKKPEPYQIEYVNIFEQNKALFGRRID